MPTGLGNAGDRHPPIRAAESWMADLIPTTPTREPVRVVSPVPLPVSENRWFWVRQGRLIVLSTCAAFDCPPGVNTQDCSRSQKLSFSICKAACCDRGTIKMKRFLILSACAVSLLGGGLPSHAQNSGTPEDEASVRAVIVKMTDDFNKHDTKALSQVYAPDADYVNVAGQSAKGPTDIEKFLMVAHSTRLKEANIKTLNLTIRLIRPDVALVRETHVMSGFLGPAGTKVPPYQETSLRVLEKENGVWLLTAAQNTTVATTQKRD